MRPMTQAGNQFCNLGPHLATGAPTSMLSIMLTIRKLKNADDR
jgi:hypothetical protein